MIITKLNGGLANQMFQYAFGRHLALIHNTTLKLDASSFFNAQAGDTPREFGLNVFNIQATPATRHEIWWLRDSKINRLLHKHKPKFKKSLIKDYNVFDPQYLHVGNNTYLVGNWQSEKYFAGSKDVLRQDFTLKTPWSQAAEDIAQQMHTQEAVGVHIRQGDYVLNPKYQKVYELLDETYYHDAARHITQKITKPIFYIFSDNISWAQQHLDFGHPTRYVSDGTLKDYEELLLMSHCTHNIVANSSFSWWGAWLNQHPDKQVIAPKKWFKNPERSTTDLIPDSWVHI